MSNESEPGGPIRTLFRPIVTSENPSDNVFVDWDVESQGNLSAIREQPQVGLCRLVWTMIAHLSILARTV